MLPDSIIGIFVFFQFFLDDLQFVLLFAISPADGLGERDHFGLMDVNHSATEWIKV